MSQISVGTFDNKSRSQSIGLLVCFLLISATMLGVGGWLTALGFGEWYDTLAKPPFQPPGWLFSPVWTTLLTLLAVATWLVARTGLDKPIVRLALVLYGIQIALNILWSLLFFTLHNPTFALWEIAILDVILLSMVIVYWRVNTWAGLMILPYLLWLGLASVINYWIVFNN